MYNYKILLLFLLMSSCSFCGDQNLVGEYEQLNFPEDIWLLESGYINDFPATKQGGYFDEEKGVVVKNNTSENSSKSLWYIDDSIMVFTKAIDDDLSIFRCCFSDGKSLVELFDVEETSIGSVSMSKTHELLAVSIASNNFIEGSNEMNFIHLFKLRDLKDGKKKARKISSDLCAHLRIVGDRIYYSKYHDVDADCLGDYGLYYRDLDDLDKEVCVDETFRFSAMSDDGNYVIGSFYPKEMKMQNVKKSFPFVIWNIKINKFAVIAQDGYYKGIYSRKNKCFYIKEAQHKLYKISLDMKYKYDRNDSIFAY